MLEDKSESPTTEMSQPVQRFQEQMTQLTDSFAKIRSAVWAKTPRPDFSRIKQDEEVLAHFTVLLALSREQVTRLIDRPEDDWETVYKRACEIVSGLHNPRIYAGLFISDVILRPKIASATAKILNSLIKLDFCAACCFAEVLRRIESRPIGKKAFTGLVEEQQQEQDVFAAIVDSLPIGGPGKRKRKISNLKSFEPEKHTTDDLRQEARLGAWTYWRKIKAGIAKEFPLLDQSVPLPRDRSRLWEKLNPILLQVEGKLWGDTFLPILRENWEKISGNAHQSLKDLWEKSTAQKRVGHDVPYREQISREDSHSGVESFAATGEARKIVDKWQQDSRHKEQAAAIIRAAEKLNQNAAKAIRARAFVQTDKEAAKLADVSQRTYRKYVSVIRKILTKAQKS